MDRTSSIAPPSPTASDRVAKTDVAPAPPTGAAKGQAGAQASRLVKTEPFAHLPAKSLSKPQPPPDPDGKLTYEQRIEAAYEACEQERGERARKLLAACPAKRRGWEWYYCQSLSRLPATPFTAIPGHDAPVRTVAFSPDGKLLASGDDERRVRICDGSQTRILGHHGGSPPTTPATEFLVRFSSNGERLLSLGGEGAFKEWDAKTGNLVRQRGGVSPGINGNLFRPFRADIDDAGTWLAAAYDTGTILGWDITKGEVTRENASASWKRAFPIRGLACSRGGERVISWGRGGIMVHYRNGSANSVDNLATGSNCGAISPDGRYAAFEKDDKVMGWDLSQRKALYRLSGHSGKIEAIAFSPDGRRIATGGRDRTLQVWDAITGRWLASLPGPAPPGPHGRRWSMIKQQWIEGSENPQWGLRSIRFSPDGESIAAASGDGNVYRWRVVDGVAPTTVDLGSKTNPERLQFSRDDSKIYLTWANDFWALDSRSRVVLGKFQGLIGKSDDFSNVASLKDGRIVIREIDRDSKFNLDVPALASPAGNDSPTIFEMRILGGGRYLFNFHKREHAGGPTTAPSSASGANYFGVWDRNVARWLWPPVKLVDERLVHIRFSSSAVLPTTQDLITLQERSRPGGDEATTPGSPAAARESGSVKVFAAKTGAVLLELPADSYTLHPGGDLIAIVRNDGINVWSLRLRKFIMESEVKGSRCFFDQQGKLIATAWKGTTTIRDMQTGRGLYDLPAEHVAFSPDGRRVVSAQAFAVVVHDASHGRDLLRLPGKSSSLAFSQNGRTLASLDGAQLTIRVADPFEPSLSAPKSASASARSE
jgi:WD40 repeat protein